MTKIKTVLQVISIFSLGIIVVFGIFPSSVNADVSCPLAPQSGRILINLPDDEYLLSALTESWATKGPFPVSIPAGTYDVTLASYDDHQDKPNQTQPNESWYLILKNNSGTVISITTAIGDLPNNQDYKVEKVNANFVLPQNISSVKTYHAAYPTHWWESWNSILPLCVAFDPISTPPPPSGPVTWLKLDELPGATTATDSSGNENTGTLVNMDPATDWVSGKINNALDFDGVNDLVNLGSATSLDNIGSGPLTFSAWINPRSVGQVVNGGIINRDDNINIGWMNFALTTNSTLSFNRDYATTNLKRDGRDDAISLGAWQHVLVTWDGFSSASNVHLYINGAEITYQRSINGVGAIKVNNNHPVTIGNLGDGSTTFDGCIDDVRIYNRILSSAEILNLSNVSGGGGTCEPFDYTLSNSGSSNVMKTSGNAFTQNTITKTKTAGEAQPITLSLSGLPDGVSAGISNQGCSLPCASVITFTVTPSTMVGTYPITVNGSPLNKQTSFNLVVSGDPIIVSCSADPMIALLGEIVIWTANVSGGTPPLIYSWSGTNIPTNPSPNTNPFNISYSTIGQKIATMTVTDASSAQVSCPVSIIQINLDPQYQEF